MKLGAVRDALRNYFRRLTLRRCHPPPGPDLPRGARRTYALARRRALRSFGNCLLSVGIESGLVGRKLITACVLYDGRQYATGEGPSFLLPWRVPPGKTLEEMFAVPNLGRRGGAIALLTRGMVDRRHITRDAVLMAVASVREGVLECGR